MLDLEIAEAAARDLSVIFLHGAECFGRAAAADYRDGLDRTFLLLREFPLIARARPDLGTAVRSRSYGSHVIFYEVGTTIRIVRVLHSVMDALTWLKETDED